ncbi:C-type lectin domain family 4 member E-like [Oncorhynchus mykiss]|uniref:C-type lectin domain-containing protein n=2 Tax=Oncorhynchus mykiss TaxID=8022 RepID=A0A8C7P3F7_ONCMY|nr:C-type lectin domain family 4 member E-like [Oncorhynchus mykiss]
MKMFSREPFGVDNQKYVFEESMCETPDMSTYYQTGNEVTPRSTPQPGNSGSDSSGKRPFLVAAVCLGMLCVLLLAGIIGLSVSFQLTAKTCTEGWQRFGCSCYYISTEVNTWDYARQDCLNRGADLVIVNSEDEQVFLTTFDRWIWIGLTDRGTQGTWKWVDGTPLTKAFWWWSEPDSATGEKDCAMMYGGVQNIPLHAWNYFRCDLKLEWICEVFFS